MDSRLGSLSVSTCTYAVPMTPEERFWSNVEKSEGCWVWQRVILPSGYGQVKWKGRSRRAHRVAYELAVGPIPRGLQLDHLCRNRACVRPDHLEAVTARVNTLRGNTITAANARKTHCIHGHAFTPENTYRYQGKRACKACRTANNPPVYQRIGRLRRLGRHAEAEAVAAQIGLT